MGLIIIKYIPFICMLAVITVETRQIKRFKDVVQDHTDDGLLLLVRGLGNGRKSINPDILTKAQILFNTLTKKALRHNYEDPKPETPEADVQNDDASLVEKELEDALAKKSSSLQDKPYVQHKGKNDFLVFRPGIKDPFVTVVPNDIYYNIEKRCVNWLDNCNERGIRERLLQRVQSPYR